MAGDEKEAIGHGWFHRFHREIEHVAGHARHQHVANDHVEIHGHDFAQAGHAVVGGGDDEVVRFEQFLERVGKFGVVVEEEDVLDLEFGGLRE